MTERLVKRDDRSWAPAPFVSHDSLSDSPSVGFAGHTWRSDSRGNTQRIVSHASNSVEAGVITASLPTEPIYHFGSRARNWMLVTAPDWTPMTGTVYISATGEPPRVIRGRLESYSAVGFRVEQETLTEHYSVADLNTLKVMFRGIFETDSSSSGAQVQQKFHHEATKQDPVADLKAFVRALASGDDAIDEGDEELLALAYEITQARASLPEKLDDNWIEKLAESIVRQAEER